MNCRPLHQMHAWTRFFFLPYSLSKIRLQISLSHFLCISFRVRFLYIYTSLPFHTHTFRSVTQSAPRKQHQRKIKLCNMLTKPSELLICELINKKLKTITDWTILYAYKVAFHMRLMWLVNAFRFSAPILPSFALNLVCWPFSRFTARCYYYHWRYVCDVFFCICYFPFIMFCSPFASAFFFSLM